MRVFLVLLIVASLSVAYAGVGVLTPREEAEALQIFENLCAGYGSDGKNLGGTLVYCKRQPGELRQHTTHKIHVKNNPAPAQAVFVQPAPVVYRHNVQIESPGNAGQQTKIYVLPQQATHQLTSEFKQSSIPPVKPVVYFLNGDISRPAPPPPPGPDYGSVEEYKAPPKYEAPLPPKPTLAPSYGTTTKVPLVGYNYEAAFNKPSTSYRNLSARIPRSHEDSITTSTLKPTSKKRVSRIRFEE